LADKTPKDPLNSELENRLNELFKEDETPVVAERREAKPVSPLAELKKIVLSIDWEITPEAVDNYLDQVGILREAYARDKILNSFLQILGSIGQYIKSSRSHVHPNTFALLNSVFASLDEVISDPKMAEPAKRKRLQAEMLKYQELREKIVKRRSADSKPQVKTAAAAAPAPAPAPGPEGSAGIASAELARAVSELKELIRSEFQLLREELNITVKRK
jgi:hypothetical protein